MTARYYRKPHRIRRKRSIFKSKIFWLVVLILIAGGGISYFLFFSSFFEIKEINVWGNEKVQKNEIENLIESRIQTDFRFFKNKNINLVNLGQINKIILATFPEIAKVSSVKNYPQKLAFNIEERTPSAIFEQNGNWFFADNEGIVFEKTDEKVASSSDFAIIRNSLLSEELKLGDGIAEKETISRIMDLQSKMRDDLKIPVKELAIVSQERLNAKTAEGWDAYFDLQGDLDWQFTKLKTVLEKRIPPEKRGNLIYIDLRFDRIYIYPETYNE